MLVKYPRFHDINELVQVPNSCTQILGQYVIERLRTAMYPNRQKTYFNSRSRSGVLSQGRSLHSALTRLPEEQRVNVGRPEIPAPSWRLIVSGVALNAGRSPMQSFPEPSDDRQARSTGRVLQGKRAHSHDKGDRKGQHPDHSFCHTVVSSVS